jgi:hypothetical protein
LQTGKKNKKSQTKKAVACIAIEVMQQLLSDIDEIVDLSPAEKLDLLNCFRRFIEHNLVISQKKLDEVFSVLPGHLLSQQEDEDNAHSLIEAAYC